MLALILLWIYAGLCFFLSHRHRLLGWEPIGMVIWFILFLVFWPVYPILVFCKLV